MKRTLTSLTLFLFVIIVYGQTLTVSVPTVTATIGQQVYIPVKLTGASSTGVPISSANIQITYDTAVLKYDTLTNFYSSTPQSQWFFTGANGLVSANWLEPSLLTLAIPDNTTLYEIKFTKKAGNSPLTFVVAEFTDAVYNLVPTTPVNGAVNAPSISRQVTFKVDMSKENITPAGVHLSGSFNNWSTTANPMTLGPNSVYSTTVSLPENQTYNYRFVNGNAAGGLETVPPSCGVMNTSGQYERSLLIPTHDTILSPVCFGMCTACPVSVNVTFRVDMQHQAVSPMGVHLAGTFNNWNYVQTPMGNTSGTVYEVSQTFEEGTYLEFLYVNGIEAGNAEVVPASCATNGHRYFTVPAVDTVLTAFCFDSCVACGTVAQYSDVTFRVDLKRLDSISVNGVHIAGSFQGWNPGATPMVHLEDSIFTYTTSLLVGTRIEYKFVNGNGTPGYENVPLLCASVAGNRIITVPGQDTTLLPVCFSACDSCGPIIGMAENGSDKPVLAQNVPNPCADYTQIGFTLPVADRIRIELVDLTGTTVMVVGDGTYPAGYHTVRFQVSALQPGVYFYRLIPGGGEYPAISRRMVVVR